MLRSTVRNGSRLKCCRQAALYSTTNCPEAVQLLPDATLSTFRTQAFQPGIPAILPHGHFASMPAGQTWFLHSPELPDTAKLNTAYLSKFGDALVPIEVTDNGRFVRVQQPLQFFLEYVG